MVPPDFYASARSTSTPFLCVGHSLESTPNRINLLGNHLSYSCPRTGIFHLTHTAHLTGTVLRPIVVHLGVLCDAQILSVDLTSCIRTCRLCVPVSGTTHNAFSLCIPDLNGRGSGRLCTKLLGDLGNARCKAPIIMLLLFCARSISHTLSITCLMVLVMKSCRAVKNIYYTSVPVVSVSVVSADS